MPSFDVVSEVDMQEVDNAVNQAKREVETRFDFKNSKSSLEREESSITLFADDNMKLRALTEILNQKMSKRGIGIRSLEFKDPENAMGGALRQKIVIKQGVSQDDGKKIIKLIKEQKLKKVQAQIQQDQVRVTGPKRDILQEVITLLKENVDLELQFVNFRD